MLLSLVKLQTSHTINKDNEALKTEAENLKTLLWRQIFLCIINPNFHRMMTLEQEIYKSEYYSTDERSGLCCYIYLHFGFAGIRINFYIMKGFQIFWYISDYVSFSTCQFTFSNNIHNNIIWVLPWWIIAFYYFFFFF